MTRLGRGSKASKRHRLEVPVSCEFVGSNPTLRTFKVIVFADMPR